MELTTKTAKELKFLKENSIFKHSIMEIINFKNELKEIIREDKTCDECVIAIDNIANLIQEIESIEEEAK